MSFNISRASEPGGNNRGNAGLCVHFPNFFHLYSFWDLYNAMKIETG